MKLRVLTTVMRSERIKHLTLVGVESPTFDPFAPGAHITVELPIDGQTQDRQYSLMNYSPPGVLVESLDIAVLLDEQGRGGSRWMHRLAPGDVLDARGPTNAFPLHATDSECIFIAGGIGITPLLCMARSCAATNRAFRFHYFARELTSPPFTEELETLPSLETGIWSGFDIDQAQQQLRRIIEAAPADAEFYVCGPNGMIDSVREISAELGRDPARVHFERFGAAAPTETDSAFPIRLSRSNTSIVVGSDQTLLAALAANGIAIPSSCGAGVCGSCLVDVLEGDIDHRDAFLLDCDKDEGRLMCACVSRAKRGGLTLDL